MATLCVLTRDGEVIVPKEQLIHAISVQDCLEDCDDDGTSATVPLLKYSQSDLETYLFFRSREKRLVALQVADYWGDTELVDSLLGEDPTLDPEGLYMSTEAKLRSLRAADYPSITFNMGPVQEKFHELLSGDPSSYRYFRGSQALLALGAVGIYLVDELGSQDVLDRDSRKVGTSLYNIITNFDIERNTVTTKNDYQCVQDLKLVADVHAKLQKTYTPAKHRYTYHFDSVFTTIKDKTGRDVAKVRGDVIVMTDQWLLLCLDERYDLSIGRYLYPRHHNGVIETDDLTLVDELFIERSGQKNRCRLGRDDLYIHVATRPIHTIYDLALMAPELQTTPVDKA